MSNPHRNPKGSYRADQIREGEPYELSHGRLIECMGTGGRGSRANLVGASVLETDPAVEEAGIDTGFSPDPESLRAPDIAVGHVPDEPGWVKGVPPLAVEYADTGQNERELKLKIEELLAAGTQMIWVVRLTGPRRVEIHEPGVAMRLAQPGEELEAPGILQNPVPVLALYDRDAAHEATLRNLLQRQGYGSLDDVREKGREEGREEGSLQAFRHSIVKICRSMGIDWSHQREAFLQEMRASELQEILDQILEEQRWPIHMSSGVPMRLTLQETADNAE